MPYKDPKVAKLKKREYYIKNQSVLRQKKKDYYQKNKERWAEYHKEHYPLVRKQKLEYHKQWRKRNRDYELQKHKEYYQTHKERFAGYSKQNKDRINKKNRERRQKDPEKYKILNRKNYEKRSIQTIKSHKIYQKKWRQKNKEVLRIKRNHYRRNNPKIKLNSDIRHLEKYGLPFKLPSMKFKYALQAWSNIVQKLHNNQCQNCTSKAEISHHILHKSKYPTLSLNVNNGIALCKKCHNECHGWKLDQN